MSHQKFEEMFEKLPAHQELIFIHGTRLFVRDADVYRIGAVRAAYQVYCVFAL